MPFFKLIIGIISAMPFFKLIIGIISAMPGLYKTY